MGISQVKGVPPVRLERTLRRFKGAAKRRPWPLPATTPAHSQSPPAASSEVRRTVALSGSISVAVTALVRRVAFTTLLGAPYQPMTSGQEPSWRRCSAVTVVIVRNLATVLALSALVLAGCGGGETTTAPLPGGQASSPATPNTSATQPTPSQSVTAAARGTLVTTADSQFGEVLFDDTGQAIYLFDKEQTTQPECYDECADAWPPVLTEGAPVPALGARADELGTTTRTDGTTQVTYAGHPLYYYAHEGKNQVLCHDVREFGGLWLAVTPSGEAAAL